MAVEAKKKPHGPVSDDRQDVLRIAEPSGGRQGVGFRFRGQRIGLAGPVSARDEFGGTRRVCTGPRGPLGCSVDVVSNHVLHKYDRVRVPSQAMPL